MQQKEYRSPTFRQAMKRFIEPLFAIDQWRKGIVMALSRVLFDVYIIFMFKRTWEIIESWLFIELTSLLVEFWVVLMIFYILKFCMMGRFWPDNTFKIIKHLRSTYLPKYLAADNSSMEKIGTGRLINIMKEGVDNQAKWIEQAVMNIPDLIIKTWVALYFVASLGWEYGIIFLWCIIIMQILVVWINSFALEARRERKTMKILRSKFFVRFLWSKFEILQSNKTKKEIAYSDSIINSIWGVNKLVNRHLRWMYNIPLFIAHSLTFLVIYYAYKTWQDGTFSLGIFNGLIATIWYFSQLLVTSTRSLKEVSKNFINIEKLWELFDTTPQDLRFSSGDDFHIGKWDIELQNIDFSYETDQDTSNSDIWNQWKAKDNHVFEWFSLSIAWGSKTALVWPSGSGKSTLVKLIAWYISPDSWSIHVDDQSLATISLGSYYAHIWYLTQEPSVFDGTIRENLMYATSDTTDETTITEAISNAQCDFVYDLPNGLDTEIGERGVRLSGWQRQRLAIAKIFLKNPKIIILDEPTAALDSESEEAITQAMNILFEDRTVIIIAHRLQTVKHADRIILIEQGKILEDGKHSQLMKEEGKYRKMVELQSGF